jgi:ABC-type uncharacterized transport system fused permease/ATPase subunit
MLPQRPYVPSGTLRRATAYPGAADDWTAEEIKKVLDKVGLAHLKDKIAEDRLYLAAKSSAWRSRGCCYTTPISSCSMKQLPRWMRRARTR